MCGFLFVYGASKFSEETLNDAFQSIAYRGSDETHVADISNKHIFLGHHRLAIRGINTSVKQPFFVEEPSCWLAYNGEIYSDTHLLTNIKKKTGRTFAYQCDTELLIESLKYDSPF